MSADTILAIDLGKYKSVACVYDRATRDAAFRTLDTTPGRARPAARPPPRRRWSSSRRAPTPAGSTTWPSPPGTPVKVANTAAEAWKFKHLKRKTDRDDALRLAELEALGQLPTVALPDPADPAVADADRPPPGAGRPAGRVPEPHPRAVRRPGAAGPARAPGVDRGRAGRDRGSRPKPLAECGPDELWRGMLDLALAAYRPPGRADRRGRGAARRAGGGRRRRRGCWRRSRASGRGRPRRWRPTWATRGGSRRASRWGRTPGWCPGSTRAG